VRYDAAGEIIQRLLSRNRETEGPRRPSARDVRARCTRAPARHVRARPCLARTRTRTRTRARARARIIERSRARALARRCATISNLLACTLITLIITPLSKADRNTKEVYSTLNYVCIAPSHQSPINFP